MGTYQIAGRRRKPCDFAYGCFFLTGLGFLVGGFAGTFSQSNAGSNALFTGLWLVFPACFVALVGIGLSLLLCRHWPLLFLSLMTVLVAAELMTEAGPVALYNSAPIGYGITCVVFALAWFARSGRLTR